MADAAPRTLGRFGYAVKCIGISRSQTQLFCAVKISSFQSKEIHFPRQNYASAFCFVGWNYYRTIQDSRPSVLAFVSVQTRLLLTNNPYQLVVRKANHSHCCLEQIPPLLFREQQRRVGMENSSNIWLGLHKNCRWWFVRKDGTLRLDSFNYIQNARAQWILEWTTQLTCVLVWLCLMRQGRRLQLLNACRLTTRFSGVWLQGKVE